MPKLHPVIEQLVRGGVYAIYSVHDRQPSQYVLVTDRGVVHPMSGDGELAPSIDKPVTELKIDALQQFAYVPDATSIQINNT